MKWNCVVKDIPQTYKKINEKMRLAESSCTYGILNHFFCLQNPLKNYEKKNDCVINASTFGGASMR